MKSALVAVAALFLGVVPAHAGDAVALLQKYRCSICHADNDTGAGPAYADVAAKYRGVPKAASTLAGIIRKGASSGGPWHMPPHPEVSKAEAARMARYILSVKD